MRPLAVFTDFLTFRKEGKYYLNAVKWTWEDAFDYPCLSSVVGVVKLLSKSKSVKLIDCDTILKKCIKINIE